MSRTHRLAVLAAALVFGVGACTDSSAMAAGAESHDASGARVYSRYGSAVPVGKGHAQSYVLYDEAGDEPIEIGVALDEKAMEGLPGPNPHLQSMPASGHEHLDNHVYMLALPNGGAAPWTFIELDWNPGGHEPPGIYDEPHFDFHFYLVPPSVRESIVPGNRRFQEKADMLPPESQRPPFYAMAAPPGAPAPAVPLMGVHWIDVRSPELQKMFGKPEAWRPFTTTFIYGSWEGQFHFLEPMITRSYILSKKRETQPEKRNEVIEVPDAPEVGVPGYYPTAYRIAWDDEAGLYRIALARLKRRG
ncbi:MAG TPA: hypothetical protein VK922_15095 [Gemmatimonadaceae bacterium]|nr:hypothetical protein [Gemmatimonadaceae bacterium]